MKEGGPHKEKQVAIGIPSKKVQERAKKLIHNALDEILDIAEETGAPPEPLLLDFIGNLIDALQSVRLAQLLYKAYASGSMTNQQVYEIAEQTNIRPMFKDMMILLLRRNIPLPEEDEEGGSSPYIG